ncbi:MAG: (Fe-S)-binding protein [Thermodesulfobacteria bacterium]|nr:(Fe-S)-binding protein [Thermodesulfobacteriota bacterium]
MSRLTKTKEEDSALAPWLARRASGDRCARCGACLSFCPVYQAVPIERYSPRGKNFLLRTADIKKKQRLIKQTVTACLQCGACSTLCGSGADVAALIREERAKSSYFQSLPHSLFSLWEKLGQERSAKAATLLKKISPILKDLHETITLSDRPFLSHLDHFQGVTSGLTPLVEAKEELDLSKVLFFTGCVQNFVLPETAAKVASFLGWKAHIPREQSCCGLPAYSQGAIKQARAFAKRNILLFRDYDFHTLVTGCASCAYMIRKWPLLFPQEDSLYPLAKEISQRVMELSQFVVSNYCARHDFAATNGHDTGTTICQIPCHQLYGLSSAHTPKEAAAMALGTGLHQESLGCCGLGGTFSLLNPDISKEIFKRNIRGQIERLSLKEPTRIITTCSGCLLRLSKGVQGRESGSRLKISHLVEVLMEKQTH